jgi:hypothetical protein
MTFSRYASPAFSPTALPNQVRERCPLRIAGRTYAGCCEWETFLDSFADAWPKWFDAPPNAQQWQMAKRDWKAGNTGWEAAHNAQRRMKERVVRRTHEAWASADAVLKQAAQKGGAGR